ARATPGGGESGPSGSGNLSFEFRTIQPECFILYLDDGGATNYLKMTLVAGRATFNYKLGDSTARELTLPTPRRLDDGRWHRAVVARGTRDGVTYRVDGTRLPAGSGELFVQRSGTFLGGIPRSYKLQSLSLTSVFFHKNRFKGSMRRVAMEGRAVEEWEVRRMHVAYGELEEACAPSK
ncbi:MAG: laminin G domain-containing protein, partial [Planctomycetota bacterium]